MTNEPSSSPAGESWTIGLVLVVFLVSLLCVAGRVTEAAG